MFNQARTVDMLSELKIHEDTHIEVVVEMKLLGVVIRSDMQWHSNTSNIISKCYSRMWLLRNLKKYGSEEHHMLETYINK